MKRSILTVWCISCLVSQQYRAGRNTKHSSYTDEGKGRRCQESADTTVKIHLQKRVIDIDIGTKWHDKKCVHLAPLDAKIKQLTTEMLNHWFFLRSIPTFFYKFGPSVIIITYLMRAFGSETKRFDVKYHRGCSQDFRNTEVMIKVCKVVNFGEIFPILFKHLLVYLFTNYVSSHVFLTWRSKCFYWIKCWGRNTESFVIGLCSKM